MAVGAGEVGRSLRFEERRLNQPCSLACLACSSQDAAALRFATAKQRDNWAVARAAVSKDPVSQGPLAGHRAENALNRVSSSYPGLQSKRGGEGQRSLALASCLLLMPFAVCLKRLVYLQ
jgi:hypothetical protein